VNDLLLALFWSLVLAGGLSLCLVLKRRGIATTYVRDLLHVGAGVWVLGWPWWSGAFAPIAIAVTAFIATFVLPAFAFSRPLVGAISGGDESWSGIVGYTASFAVFTTLGLLGEPLPAAIALLSLSLGDGLGGLAGRRFGRVEIRAPFAKKKTLEGSMVVFGASFAGAYLAAFALGDRIALATAAMTALAAALSEAIAPRSMDNLLVPLATWSVAAVVVS
jgi:dolichol kinase